MGHNTNFERTVRSCKGHLLSNANNERTLSERQCSVNIHIFVRERQDENPTLCFAPPTAHSHGATAHRITWRGKASKGTVACCPLARRTSLLLLPQAQPRPTASAAAVAEALPAIRHDHRHGAVLPGARFGRHACKSVLRRRRKAPRYYHGTMDCPTSHTRSLAFGEILVDWRASAYKVVERMSALPIGAAVR